MSGVSYYQNLERFVNSHINPEEGHFFERSWYYIFGPRVKTLVVTSENYKPLFDMFYDTLQPTEHNLDMIIHNLDTSISNKLTNQKDIWYYAMERKIEFINQTLPSLKEGEHVIVTDADIYFFDPKQIHMLVQTARIKDLDFYGMQEDRRDEFNGGFYILKNTQEMRDFYKEIYKRMCEMRYPYGDQSIINELLPTLPFKTSKIPREYCVWGRSTPTKEAIFHHATCTENVADKIRLIIDTRMRHKKIEHSRSRSINQSITQSQELQRRHPIKNVQSLIRERIKKIEK